MQKKFIKVTIERHDVTKITMKTSSMNIIFRKKSSRNGQLNR